MNISFKTVLGIAGVVVATQAVAQVTFYEREGFRGRSFTADRPIGNFERFGFNDRASSAVVDSGNWQVCEDAGFSGRCVVLRPGRYDSLAQMGLDNQISSVRVVEGRAGYEGGRRNLAAGPDSDYRRRPDERLFEVPVTSVRAVVGPPEQRCWVERQQVVGDDRGGPNVPGAIAGAVIGGVLGHQIGGGHGRDVATAGGAVAGAAIGANVDRGYGGGEVYSRDVQRCASVPGDARPDYWDVTYTFRGQVHRIQTQAPPGPTITVNANGEPRL